MVRLKCEATFFLFFLFLDVEVVLGSSKLFFTSTMYKEITENKKESSCIYLVNSNGKTIVSQNKWDKHLKYHGSS